MRVMPKLSQEGSTKPPSSTMPAGVCQIVILSTSAGAPLTASAHAPTLPATASGICFLAGLLQQTAQGHRKALIHQPFSSVTQGCQQKQGPSICYVSKARDALDCQAMGAGHTCLDCNGVAQAGLILVPCDLDVGPVLESPRMVLWGLPGPQLLALECDCAGTWHVSLCAWTEQCTATGVLHSSGWMSKLPES